MSNIIENLYNNVARPEPPPFEYDASLHVYDEPAENTRGGASVTMREMLLTHDENAYTSGGKPSVWKWIDALPIYAVLVIGALILLSAFIAGLSVVMP